MDNPTKEQLKNALLQLKESFKTINTIWQDSPSWVVSQYLDDNYPFGSDFNELTTDVIEWVDVVAETIELEQKAFDRFMSDSVFVPIEEAYTLEHFEFDKDYVEDTENHYDSKITHVYFDPMNGHIFGHEDGEFSVTLDRDYHKGTYPEMIKLSFNWWINNTDEEWKNEKQFFLFGDAACTIFRESGGFHTLIKAKDHVDFTVVGISKNTPPENVLSIYNGWNDFEPIDRKSYLMLFPYRTKSD